VIPRILLIEDDAVIGEHLHDALTGEFEPHWERTGAKGLQHVVDADLVILDLGLPDVDGIDVCRQIRIRHPNVPVIMVTARQREIDVIMGLEAGAVDYVSKPFRLAELLARIRVHLREDPERSDRIATGSLVVDPASRRSWLNGVELDLRAKEFDLLHELARRAGAVVTRGQLMRDVWDDPGTGSTKTLDVHMAALRRKLADADRSVNGAMADAAPAVVITTLRGVGFRLERA